MPDNLPRKYLLTGKVCRTFPSRKVFSYGEGEMDEQVRPDEAARALAEIGQAQEQVIKLAVIPTWFWWAIGVLMLGFSAAVESKRDLAIGIGTAVFVLGVIASTGFVVFGPFRRAQVR